MNALLIIPFTRLRWHPTNCAARQKWGGADVAPKQTTRDDFLARQRRPITGVLDGVTQNYNIGAIFRTPRRIPRTCVDPNRRMPRTRISGDL